MTATRRWAAAVSIAGVCGFAVHGQAASPQEQAAARAMFDEGKLLAGQGKYELACVKLEESQRIEPGVGTQFHLADCYEHIGRTASAWALFLDAAGQSRGAGKADRERVLRERAATLEARLARVVISVSEGAEVAGLTVQRDGGAVGKGMWGTAVPVDPGKHVIVATAPGRKRWVSTITVSDASTQSVTVPVLAEGADEPVAAATVKQPSDSQTASSLAVSDRGASSPNPGSTQRFVGLALGGVGLVGLGAAAYFGLSAKGKMNDAKADCDGDLCRTQAGIDLRHEAVQSQTLAYITAGVGGAALVGGLIAFLTAPSGQPDKSAMWNRTPTVSLLPGGLMMQGRW